MQRMKIRNTNIEILRIILMLMIIGSHLVIYGIVENPNTEIYLTWSKGSIMNRSFSCLLIPGGDIAVGVFFLISGYFLSKKQNIIELNKIFYVIYFYSIFTVTFTVIYELLTKSIILNLNEIGRIALLPITNSTWWFCTAYVFLIISAPYFNRLFMDVSSKKKYIIILYVGGYVLGKIFSVTYYIFIRAIWFYLVGLYIHGSEIKIKRKNLMAIFLFNWLFYSGCTYMIGMIASNNISITLIEEGCKLLRFVVCAPIASVSLFLLFLNTSIEYNSQLNMVAKTTFGIYLIHEMPYMREILWNHIFPIDLLYKKSIFPIAAICIIILIFFFGMCIDLFRESFIESKISYIFWCLKKKNKGDIYD